MKPWKLTIEKDGISKEFELESYVDCAALVKIILDDFELFNNNDTGVTNNFHTSEEYGLYITNSNGGNNLFPSFSHKNSSLRFPILKFYRDFP